MAAILDFPGTYATAAAAIAAIPNNMSGQGLQEVVGDKGVYPESPTINGFINTSSVDKILLRPKAGDECKLIYGSGVVFGDAVTGFGMSTNTAHTEFRDVQYSGGMTGQYGILLIAVAGNCIAQNCLVKGFDGTLRGIAGFDGNNKIICCVSQNYLDGYFSTGAGHLQRFLNNLAYGNTNGYVESGSSNMQIFNGVGVNNSGSDYGAGTSGDSNTSEDGSAPGTNPNINITEASMNFANAPTDFHIDVDSSLAGAGLDQSGIFTEDADGNTIPLLDWPAGPDYPVVFAGGEGGGSLSLDLSLEI